MPHPARIEIGIAGRDDEQSIQIGGNHLPRNATACRLARDKAVTVQHPQGHPVPHHHPIPNRHRCSGQGRGWDQIHRPHLGQGFDPCAVHSGDPRGKNIRFDHLVAKLRRPTQSGQNAAQRLALRQKISSNMNHPPPIEG
jgi:hypothetical protein